MFGAARAVRRTALWLALMAIGLGGSLVASSSASADPVVSAYMTFTLDDSGPAQTYRFSTDAGNYFQTYQGVSNGDWHYFNLEVAQPNGWWRVLVGMTGLPTPATRQFSYTQPSLRANMIFESPLSPYCQPSSGNFTIYRSVFAGEQLTGIDLGFDNACPGRPSTHGRVIWNLPFPTAPAAGSAAVTAAESVSDDRGVIRLAAQAPSGVSALTARVFSSAGNEAATVTNFVRQSGTATDGVWLAQTPLVLPDLGMYRIDTELTDGAGNHVIQQNMGYLAYEKLARFANLSMTPSTADSQNRTPYLSGTLQSVWPGTRATSPISAATVSINAESVVSAGAPYEFQEITAGDGSFARPIRATHEGSIRVNYPGNPADLLVGAPTSSVAVGFNKQDASLSATLSASSVVYGSPITITGTIGWPGAILPDEAQYQIRLEYCDSTPQCDLNVQYAAVDASGNYAVTFTPYDNGKIRMVFPGGLYVLPVSTPYQAITVRPAKRGTFTAFSGYWTGTRTANLQASIVFSDPQPTSAVIIRFQFRWYKSAQWVTLTSYIAVKSGAHWNVAGAVTLPDSGELRAVYVDASGGASSALAAWCNCRDGAPRRV